MSRALSLITFIVCSLLRIVSLIKLNVAEETLLNRKCPLSIIIVDEKQTATYIYLMSFGTMHKQCYIS